MEKFFISNFKVNQIEVTELLLRRYNNIEYILELNFEEGYEFIIKAYKKEAEERLWEQWLVDYSRMNTENFESFEDYKNRSISKDKEESNNENLTKEQIEGKVKNIIDLTLGERR